MTTERIGRYEVEKQLGAGAMAVVYKAVDPVIGRTVAIKTIKFDSGIGFEQEELRQRFYREAKSAGKLNHPNIVTIYDVGEAGNLDYIAMEFVDGESLHDWMAKNPIPPLQQTVSIIEQIASGLDYAARADIIHRDIKPANILLTQDMRAKIADFGIAKVSTSKFTQTGAVIGTPSYMSPEQALGKTLDGRSDIFSLGVIFYEMLTGEKPFTGTNPSTIIYKILHEEPVQPQQLNVTLHPAFNEIVRRMLAKDPDNRYQNCSQLIQDLRNYTSLTIKEAKPDTPPVAATVEPKRSGKWVFAFVFLLVAALAAAGYLYYPKLQSSFFQDTAAVPEISQPSTGGTEKLAASSQKERQAVQKPPLPNQQANETVGTVNPPAAKPVSENRDTADTALSNKAVRTLAADQTRPAETEKSRGGKKLVADESARAEIRLEFAGANYPVTVYDGASVLKDLSAANPSIQINAGSHSFRVVSDAGFLDQKLERVRLEAGQVYTLSVPALCSAFIEVPNDAYDGCEIELNGKKIPSPYPAQIPKLAAGNHQVIFRWNSGKYSGKELVSTFESESGHHYRIRGEPAGEKVLVQQIR